MLYEKESIPLEQRMARRTHLDSMFFLSSSVCYCLLFFCSVFFPQHKFGAVKKLSYRSLYKNKVMDIETNFSQGPET